MDVGTFQAEVKRIEKLLYRVAWSSLGNRQDVEDAVQDALMKAWEKRASLRSEASFSGWMVRILTNQCRSVLRKRRRGSFFPLEEETVVVAPPQELSPVEEAMRRLRPPLRIVTTLYYADGYTVQDIAEALGIPIGTVKTRLHSARKQLRHILLVEWEERI